MKRTFDFFASALLLVLVAPLWILVGAAIRATSPGPALFRTRRVGRYNELFTMYKFRTMRIDTPQVATHLLENPDTFLTPIGAFLRRTSLDELPQLLNVLRGEMSLVGPRPALFNQHDLVSLRTQQGVHRLVPGITGWAQVNGRDELPLQTKVALDAEYLARRNLLLDLGILARTVTQSLTGRGVSH
jgi:O-antigen biosynthesis protein WbqP